MHLSFLVKVARTEGAVLLHVILFSALLVLLCWLLYALFAFVDWA